MSKELEGVTAILASPTYGPVDSDCAKSLRVAVMNASNHGLTWAGDASTNRVGWSGARNQAAQCLMDLKGEADGCMWVDSDILVPPQGISRLINTAIENKLDILSGVYHQRGMPFKPVIYHWDKKRDVYKEIDDYNPNMVITPGGCGFGFVWTSYNVIKSISEHKAFDRERGGWFPDTRHIKGGKGEDFNFCSLAHKAGFDINVDTGVLVGHMGETEVITRKHFVKAKEDIVAGHVLPKELTPVERWGSLG